jgi:hypothetical protein
MAGGHDLRNDFIVAEELVSARSAGVIEDFGSLYRPVYDFYE